MRIVKIIKRFRNGFKEHFMPILDNSYSDISIDDLVDEWCDSDPAGDSNGYSYEWTLVEDKTLIGEVIKKEIKIVDDETNYLARKKDILTKELTLIDTN
jgi:hypothetical protein